MNYPQNRITQLGIGVAYKYKKVLEKFLKGKKYDAIVNSITYALPVICELAKKYGLLFHMEAGNRCKDECLPEETNRRIVDVISDVNLLLFRVCA